MATQWISPTWRMPDEQNQSKFENYSLDFNGNADYISLDNTSTLSFADNFSISMWINPSSLSGFQMLFSGSGYSGGTGIGHYIYDDTVRTYVSVSGSATQIFQSSALLNIGDWTHVIIQREKGTKWEMWINGVLNQSNSVSNLTDDLTSASSTIARHYNNPNYNFNGEIGQTTIYDFALTSAQITALYNSGTPINPMAISGNPPIAYYPLGGSSTGSSSTLTTPNESVPSATVFDFLAAPTYSKISLGTSDFIGNKSISFWLNKNANNGSVFAFGNTNYYPNVQSTTLQLNNGSTTVLSTGTINLNEWNHYVITGDGTTAKCYVNGVYKSTGTDRDISSATNWIGGQNNGTGMLNGELSNIQKWNAVLSDGGASIGDIAGGSISTLYNNGVPYTGTQPQAANLKAWWKMNVDNSTWNGSDWIIEDSSVTTKTPNYTKALSKTGYGANYLNFKTTTSLTTSDELTSSFWLKTAQAGNIGIASGTVGMGPFSFANSSILISRAPNNYRYFTPRGPMNDGNWHHILVYSPGYAQTDINSVRVFVDGIEIIAGNGHTATAPTYDVGSSIGLIGSSNYLNGNGTLAASNVAVWQGDKTNDIAEIYNGGTPALSYSNTPDYWFTLTDILTSTGGGWYDSSGNSNTVSGVTNNPTVVDSSVLTIGNFGTSSGMTTANLVNSDLTRSIPYSSYSMEFDGINDYISFPADASLNISTANHSMSFWLKTTDSGICVVSQKAQDELATWIQSSKIKWEAENPFSSTSNINDGTWKHICFVADGSNSYIYINGVLDATGGSQIRSAASGSAFAIGSRPGSFPYEGSISNWALFNKALTEDQILTIYNGGVPNDISSLSPVSWWSLAGDSYFNGNDWICPDLGSGSNNGTSNGMGGTELVGNGPGSTANGIATSMNIPGNLKGNAPNSSKNAFSVNMNSADRVADVPA